LINSPPSVCAGPRALPPVAGCRVVAVGFLPPERRAHLCALLPGAAPLGRTVTEADNAAGVVPRLSRGFTVSGSASVSPSESKLSTVTMCNTFTSSTSLSKTPTMGETFTSSISLSKTGTGTGTSSSCLTGSKSASPQASDSAAPARRLRA
jgi:hypothetical protein